MRLLRWWGGITWRIERAWALLRVYWGTEDCDWSTIALVLRHQIRRTRLHVVEHGKVVDAGRIARQMMIAETLLDRMLDGLTYYDIATARYPKQDRAWAKLVHNLEQQDDEMLAILLRKHLRSWWD